jgi:serine/threonine protein kinase
MPISAIGKFQVLGTLGQGAHSTILHIRCSNDAKQYALKVVPINSSADNKFLEQAQHEFRVAQMLDHPNLIKVHALETPRDWLFRIQKVHLLIEYVNGQTLDSIKGLSVPRLVQVFAKVAAGLAHMHRRGVYHADLKPGNIMLSRSGDVKIIDFGLAWIKGKHKDRVQGTPEYMAPEQAMKTTVNEQTDLYNFGATMYRLTTWRLPPLALPGTDGARLKGQAFNEQIKPVAELSPQAPTALCELIHHCLEYNPVKRPKSMMDVQDSLDQLVKIVVRTPEDSLETMEW